MISAKCTFAATEKSSPAGQAPEPKVGMAHRRSDRISWSVPIRVAGTDITGECFEAGARTISLSRHGASIVLAQKLAPVQQIKVVNLAARKEATARVVGQIGGQSHQYVYNVDFGDSTKNIWNIRFPPLSEADQATGRLLLQCLVCRASEVVYLNELEIEVFEANAKLSRSCQHCNDWTVWKQATLDHDQRDAGREAPAERNRRTNVRVDLKRVTACIRQAGFGEELVHVDDVSRGGLLFCSLNLYYVGSRIEVAVPYTPAGANIFVPARVVRILNPPGEGSKKHGAAYMRN